MKKVVLLVNPKSGTGKAERLAADLVHGLGQAGHEVSVVIAGGARGAAFEAALAKVGREGACIIIGGDGTLHHALGRVVASGAAVYHAPTGTENLFARQFGMKADVQSVLAALERDEVVEVDLGVCEVAAAATGAEMAETAGMNGAVTIAGRKPADTHRLFALMVSVGPDASVIHRLERKRTKGAGHWMYLRPIAAEFVRPHLRRVRVTVDERVVVDGGRGMVVVANSRQYAARIDPARDADMRDGRLDVVFLPGRTSLGLLWQMWRARRRVHIAAGGNGAGRGGVIVGRGERVRVETLDGAGFSQVDGEAMDCREVGRAWELGVRARALRVLVGR